MLPAMVQMLEEMCDSRMKLLQRQCTVKLVMTAVKVTWAKVHQLNYFITYLSS